MTRDRFVDIIENGDDIMFTIDEHGYTILTWPDDGPIIGEWNKEETLKQYKTTEELIENYSINGIPLESLVEKIKMKSYTRVRE